MQLQLGGNNNQAFWYVVTTIYNYSINSGEVLSTAHLHIV